MFHCAATVRFDEDLSKALTMNVSAVSFIISLCKKMKRLESLVHVSTAYCHCQRPHIEEKSYPPPTQPNSVAAARDRGCDTVLQVSWADYNLRGEDSSQ